MPVMETVTIINKSGKVVSTGKHLVNIFKDAKNAYNEKKAEMQGEHQKRIAYKNTQRLIQVREETQSVASSRHSRRSSRSTRHRHTDNAGPSRPPLTRENLSQISEGSVTSSRRSRSSHHGSRRPKSPPPYRTTLTEDDAPAPGITRRHTDFPADTQISRRTLPPPYTLHRSISNPDLSSDDKIDMNLAYGELHIPAPAIAQEQELAATMTKLDVLLTEAHCLQHSATTIIANLQANPEAMAAVALTLAELSNILKTMSPGILTALKASSPAIFALLASPQFLIAGGVALGCTVVMFGGYKIIKKIQANNAAQKEAMKMETAMVYDGAEMGSVDMWRRGIVVEGESDGTSVEGEFITPEAMRRKKEHIRDRAREERWAAREESVYSESTVRAGSVRAKSVVSESTVRQRDIPVRSSSSRALPAPSESGRSERSSRTVKTEKTDKTSRTDKSHRKKESKGKELVLADKKKGSALAGFLKKHKEKGEKKEGSERSSSRSHRPKMIEM